MMSMYYMVVTSTGNETQAVDVAKWAVETGLARCVQIIPRIRSIYHWDGEICDDVECLLFLKTTEANLAHLMRLLPERHPYEVPEVVSIPISAGHEPYLKWLDEWQYKESP